MMRKHCAKACVHSNLSMSEVSHLQSDLSGPREQEQVCVPGAGRNVGDVAGGSAGRGHVERVAWRLPRLCVSQTRGPPEDG